MFWKYSSRSRQLAAGKRIPHGRLPRLVKAASTSGAVFQWHHSRVPYRGRHSRHRCSSAPTPQSSRLKQRKTVWISNKPEADLQLSLSYSRVWKNEASTLTLDLSFPFIKPSSPTGSVPHMCNSQRWGRSEMFYVYALVCGSVGFSAQNCHH